MTREEIKPNDSMDKILEKMGEGNAFTDVLLSDITKNGLRGWSLVLALDKMNMRGDQIWSAYKDYCAGDLKLFWNSVEQHDQNMVKAVNIESAKHGKKDKATTEDGSKDKEKLIFSDKEMKALSKENKIMHEKINKQAPISNNF